jgi:hypothetical protein
VQLSTEVDAEASLAWRKSVLLASAGQAGETGKKSATHAPRMVTGQFPLSLSVVPGSIRRLPSPEGGFHLLAPSASWPLVFASLGNQHAVKLAVSAIGRLNI